METPPEESDVIKDDGEAIPVCIKCFKPVNHLANYCPNCGEATGNLTQYLPFVNIQWQADFWGKAWRQIWSPDISIAGRLLRFSMIVWLVPILLIGLLFKLRHKAVNCQHEDEDSNQPADTAN